MNTHVVISGIIHITLLYMVNNNHLYLDYSIS